MVRSALVLFASLSLVGLAGCATSSEDEEVATASDEVTAAPCGARYGEALQHYKNAVAYSKERLASSSACEWEQHGFLWEIADEASRAVMICPAFRQTIRDSQWAAPLREALGMTLNLRSYTGELAVIRDSQWQNWNGVEDLLPGTTFWAQAQGAYGPPARVDFAADGSATWGYLDLDDQDNIVWRSGPATWDIDNPSGLPSGKRTVRVTHDGVTETFALNVQNPSWAGYNDAPLFVLVPSDDTEAPALYSLVTECDA